MLNKMYCKKNLLNKMKILEVYLELKADKIYKLEEVVTIINKILKVSNYRLIVYKLHLK
jgi:hypothetical protein